MKTIVLERGAFCTVVWSVDAGELRVRVGDECLTPRDLVEMQKAIAAVLEERERATAPLPAGRPRVRHGSATARVPSDQGNHGDRQS